MRLIMIAAPGAGKGTQAEVLSKHFNIPTISTGAILRKNIKDKTPLGDIASEYIDDGKFVPDDIMIEIVKDRLSKDDCKEGFILDGYPRNLQQALALKNAGINLDKVLTLEVKDEDIVQRLSNRIECSSCGASYNTIYRAPKTEGKCDLCGGELKRREDDQPDIIQKRLDTYHEVTEPLKEFYKNEGILVTAYGKEGIEATSKEVISVLS